MKNIFLVLLFCGILGIGTSFGQTTIRETDFRNFTFQPMCGAGQSRSITVRKGLFYSETSTPGVATKRIPNPPPVVERSYFRPYQYIFADLDNDGLEEAVILSLCATGGSGNFTEGYIYGMNGQTASLRARIEGGDRAFGGIRQIKLINRPNTSGQSGLLIVVERSRPGEPGLACCPEEVETTVYSFENDNLVQFGEKTVSEIYPPVRITETGGSARFDVSISRINKIRRFVISGRKGQRLRVTASEPTAKIRIFRGKAKLEMEKNPTNNILFYNSTNRLDAKLEETGDFVFEISNLSNEDINFTVTVSLN